MEFILGILGYLGIGFVWLMCVAFMDKKFKLDLFWDHDPWEGWSKNYGEICVLIGWPLIIPAGGLFGMLYLLHHICMLITGKKSPNDEQEKEPESKLKNDLLYNHLLSKGVNESDAVAIAKEMEEYGPEK
jgi:hypothetical protein